MHPFLNLKIIQLPMYGLCILAGMVAAAIVSLIMIKRNSKDIWSYIIVVTVTAAAGFAGAKILYILVTYPVKYFFKILFVTLFPGKTGFSSGFVFYGGLLTGIPFYFISCKIASCSYKEFVNEAAVCVPLVHGFGRIGCFFAGCCYGMEYDGPFSVMFHSPLSFAPVDVSLFPVQLFESVLLFALFLVLVVLYFKNKDNLIFIYIFSYSLIRFVTEFFRGDVERGVYGFFSTSKIISLGMALSAVIVLLVLKFIKKQKTAS